MFSLIITIILIALVAALALATLYYGGDAYNQGRADAEAGKVINQGQQLLGAAEIYFVKEGFWPADIEAMVDAGYLKSIPVAQAPGQALGSALANGTPWTMPAPGQPVFVLPGVDTPTCQRVNKRTFDLDGILPRAHTALAAQCYGAGPATFNVVVAKGGAALGPAAAANSPSFPSTDLTTDPVPDAADLGAWTVPPGTVVATGPGGGELGGGESGGGGRGDGELGGGECIEGCFGPSPSPEESHENVFFSNDLTLTTSLPAGGPGSTLVVAAQSSTEGTPGLRIRYTETDGTRDYSSSTFGFYTLSELADWASNAPGEEFVSLSAALYDSEGVLLWHFDGHGFVPGPTSYQGCSIFTTYAGLTTNSSSYEGVCTPPLGGG